MLVAVSCGPAGSGGDAGGDTDRGVRSAPDDDGSDAGLLVEEPGEDGGIVGPYKWQLTGVSPDETLLHVSTVFGDCDRWEGWEIAESEEQVVIAARLWQDPDAGDCTSEANPRDQYVRLEEPLGDRQLVGCQTADCRSGPHESGAPGGSVDAAVEALVARNPAGRFSLDPDDGTVRWREEHPGAGDWHATDGMVLIDDGNETTTAVDPADGTERWSVTGSLLDIVGDLVLTCRGETDEGTTRRYTDAHERLTGDTRWSVEIGCGRNVGTNDDVLAVAGQQDDGRAEIAALDPTDGRERWRTDVEQGGSRLVIVGDRLFVDADGGILAVDLADGSTSPIDVDAHAPIGVADSTVFAVSDREVVAFDAHNGEVRWAEPVGEAGVKPPVIVDGNAVFITDSDAGIVERRNPNDGELMWRADVGRSGGIDAAVQADTAFVATSVAVVALHLETGEQLWWTPLTPE